VRILITIHASEKRGHHYEAGGEKPPATRLGFSYLYFLVEVRVLYFLFSLSAQRISDIFLKTQIQTQQLEFSKYRQKLERIQICYFQVVQILSDQD